MTFLKLIVLQSFWFFVVLFGNKINSSVFFFGALIILFFSYSLSKKKISIFRYLAIALFFTCVGFFHDTLLILFRIVAKDSYSYSSLSLWIVFIAYYDDIFVKFKNISVIVTSLFGAIGGAFAYWTAYKLGALELLPERHLTYVLFSGFVWGIFFPVSMFFYYQDKFWELLLDKSILFSFDNSGFYRHQKNNIEDFSQKDIHSTVSLITGGTSGIGEEIATELLKRGGRVFVTGRNEGKGKNFEANNVNSKFVSLDMENWDDVRSYCRRCEAFDYVVLNAGSMPQERKVNRAQVESQCAAQLIGHYLLIKELKDNGKLRSKARIVWVSSGGMYLKKLDLSSLFENLNYDKVSTYANVKRAQVTLVQELSLMQEWKEFLILAMHPGWVDTPGLKEALPTFYGVMKGRLRTPKEGADTILWLLLTQEPLETGGFYFDRKKSSPYILKSYDPSLSQRQLLIERLLFSLQHR